MNMKMNDTLKRLHFEKFPIRAIVQKDETIVWLCLNDLLKVLDRTCMMDNGQAMRICKTSRRVPFKEGGRNRWGVKPYDVHNLLRAIRPENGMVAKMCNRMQEAKLKETEKSLADAQTVIAGKDATITNLQKDLTTATTSLTAYQEKEAKEKQAKNEAMIEAAIVAGKITRESKEGWLAMAGDNPELVEKTLGSIPDREQISKEIAKDSANIQSATDGLKTAEEKIAEKVTQVVGETFEFKKIQ